MFTTSFLHSTSGNWETTPVHQTKRAAQRHTEWLIAQPWVKETKLHRGQAGEELVEHRTR